jgi:hypothetical protein
MTVRRPRFRIAPVRRMIILWKVGSVKPIEKLMISDSAADGRISIADSFPMR